jgi:signal peptide peptidase SppA
MKSLPDLLRPHSEKPWPMEPQALAGLLSGGYLADTMSPPSAGPKVAPKVRGAVAVIPLEGVIMPWKAEAFADAVLSASADPSISAIVMAVDSPGGVITGVPEAADAIRGVRNSKPMVAVSTGMNASAAYWLSSAAKTVVSSPSAYTGSIGVWTAHADLSKMLEDAGIKVTLISAGKHKVEGNMFAPLSDEAKAAIQEDVDDAYGQFVKAVASHRGVSQQAVREGYGEGRVLNAERAKKAGLIDEVGTLGTVIGALIPPSGRNAKTLLRKLDLDAA